MSPLSKTTNPIKETTQFTFANIPVYVLNHAVRCTKKNAFKLFDQLPESSVVQGVEPVVVGQHDVRVVVQQQGQHVIPNRQLQFVQCTFRPKL